MSTLHHVTSILIGILFVVGYLKLVIEQDLKYKTNALTHAFIGIVMIFARIIRVIAASKLGFINEFYWLSVIPFAVYGLFGIYSLVYYEIHKKTKREELSDENEGD